MPPRSPAEEVKPKRGEVTIMSATSLGGPERLKGNLILTDLTTATSCPFWVNYGANVGLVLNCIGPRSGVHKVVYPPESAKSLKLFIEVRNTHDFANQFAKAAPQIEKTLESGKDVVLHCRESYHRAPIVVAATLARLCGVGYLVGQQNNFV